MNNIIKTAVLATAMTAISFLSAQAQNDPFGIGTSNPQAMLHLHSASPATPIVGPTPMDSRDSLQGRDDPFSPDDEYFTTFLMTNGYTGNTEEDGLFVFLHNDTATIRQQSAAPLRLTVPGGYLHLAPNGHLGLGTLPGDYYLKVNGKAYFSGSLTLYQGLTMGGTLKVGDGFSCDAQGNMKVKHLKVTLTDWPDYVFSKDRRLMTLGELEAYIDRNGHLPGIPSATEVERDGADLGEMNKLLMEKVEELTLYILDLQKQIDELKENQ